MLHTGSFSYSVKEDAELRSKPFKCSKKKKKYGEKDCSAVLKVQSAAADLNVV